MSKITSSMAGNVYKVLVHVGEKLEPGMEVVVLESMKMEIPIEAVAVATVKEVKVAEGDFVNEGDVLIELE